MNSGTKGRGQAGWAGEHGCGAEEKNNYNNITNIIHIMTKPGWMEMRNKWEQVGMKDGCGRMRMGEEG